MLLGSNTFCAIFVAKCMLVIILVSETLASNYPDSNNPKPCARKKNVITESVPICVPRGKDSWTKESEENCAGTLKQQCPEFNEAECMWYTWKPLGCTRSVTLPACRLKYYAKKYTWMEIYYANQYGTWADSNQTVFDIIEIHRMVKNQDAFPHAEQNDYPENVLNPQGERGLTWTLLSDPLVKMTTAEPICSRSAEGQELCTRLIKSVLQGYPIGFLKMQVPPITNKENAKKAVISLEQSAKCVHALVNGVKTDVCQVLFTRVATCKKEETRMTVMEAQAWSETRPYHYSWYADLKIRYAHFNTDPQPEV